MKSNECEYGGLPERQDVWYILHEVSQNKRNGPVGMGISTYTDGNTNRASFSGAKKIEDRVALYHASTSTYWGICMAVE
jgi:hypothetical protein